MVAAHSRNSRKTSSTHIRGTNLSVGDYPDGPESHLRVQRQLELLRQHAHVQLLEWRDSNEYVYVGITSQVQVQASQVQ